MTENYDGPVDQLGAAVGHFCYLYRLPSGEHKARCACGQSWTYAKDRTWEQMISIYESHLRYFNKPKQETL